MTKNFIFSENEIHIWQFNINEDYEYFAKYGQILEKKSWTKITNFYHEHDQHTALLSAVCPRILLARYLKTKPNLINFKYNKYGKPFHEANSIFFNISHSQNIMLVAITSKEIGIDVEFIDIKLQYLEIANSVFSKNELELLKNHPETEAIHLFYELWCKKEALLKAMGTGFSIDPQLIDSFSKTHTWHNYSLQTNKSYKAFCAYKDDNAQIRYFSKKELQNPSKT